MSFELDDDMKAALVTFIQESVELLHELEDRLMILSGQDSSDDDIQAIFRCAHTIKGTAGLFGLDAIVRFTHIMENVLDRVRKHELDISPDLIGLLLKSGDHLRVLVDAASHGRETTSPEQQALGEYLLNQLKSYQNTLELPKTSANTQHKVETIDTPQSASGNWLLFLQFNEHCLRDGMDPLAFIRYLTTLGDIVELSTFAHNMPDAEHVDPETNYLSFEIILSSNADKETIAAAFEFVREGSVIHIIPLEHRIPYYVELINSLSPEDAKLGELLIKCGVITQHELDQGLNTQSTDTATNKPIGEILVEQRVVQQPIVNAALTKQKDLKEQKARENRSIRIDAERLDKLIDLIGELVISTSVATLSAKQVRSVALHEAHAHVNSLVEAVRSSALQLRMVPIGTVFSRFQRVVYDISKELNKDIKLVINGAETEVDKSVVEKISDPLTHMVRNAIDHGIETAAARLARGKPEQGTVKLNAYHSSGSIVIEVSDDGNGLDKDRILSTAMARGLITPGTELTEQEIYALIFEPGFSTATQISNLSGRGVGMDVVKRNINDLRGAIKINSETGMGTTIEIHLPLTLAIINGFLTKVGNISYIIPLDRVIECLELPANEQHDYMELRGEVLPFIRLREVFNNTGPINKRQNIIVVEHLGLKAGLVVDRLLGELQTVIKPLGELFSHVQGVNGSTILGSGEVALIIDVATLLAQQEKLMQASLTSALAHIN